MRGRVSIEPYEKNNYKVYSKNKFSFNKNMQGDIMHDDARCHDDAKNKITSNYLIGVFSPVVTKITRNMARSSCL
jgi:hypothetical protein